MTLLILEINLRFIIEVTQRAPSPVPFVFLAFSSKKCARNELRCARHQDKNKHHFFSGGWEIKHAALPFLYAAHLPVAPARD